MAEFKTNVMRILEKNEIAYTPHEYPRVKEAADGISVAKLLGQNPETVFKTLVTKGSSGNYFVFVIPVACELDLKKAARSVQEKAVEMIPVKELQKVTGYIRGGCSPIGMKKPYITTYHETAGTIPSIVVSGGKIGYQIELKPRDLIGFTRGKTADIVKR